MNEENPAKKYEKKIKTTERGWGTEAVGRREERRKCPIRERKSRGKG